MKQFKRILRTLNAGKIACAAIAIFLLSMSVGEVITFLKPAKDFEDLLTGEVRPGDHIQGEVLYLLDYFSTEQSWTENSNGSVTPRKTSAYYYIVPGNNIYLGLKVSPDDHSRASALAEETYAYLTGVGDEPEGGFSYTGKVIRMEEEYPEMVTAFQQELGSYGYLAQEIFDMGEPMLIVRRSFSGVMSIFGVGVALLLLAALWIAKDIRKANRRAAAKAAAKAAQEGPPPASGTAAEDPWNR